MSEDKSTKEMENIENKNNQKVGYCMAGARWGLKPYLFGRAIFATFFK